MDYLEHFDLAQSARQAYAAAPSGSGVALRVQAKGPLAERLVKAPAKGAKEWDAAVEEIDAEDLLTAHGLSLDGWLGPPWLKDGWFHAYLLAARALRRPAGRPAAD